MLRALGPEKTSPKHRLAVPATTAVSEGTRGPWRPGADAAPAHGVSEPWQEGWRTWLYHLVLWHTLSPLSEAS